MASTVGERIRLRRQALGLSQKELGERVGASESSVVAWEKDRWFPARKQGSVEAVLGISLNEEPGTELDPREQEIRDLAARLGLDPQDWINVYRARNRAAPAPGGRERAG